MPKYRNNIDIAAHYTQLYHEDPEAKRYLDTYNVQDLHKIVKEKMNSMLGKEQIPDDLLKLEINLRGFINTTKEAGQKLGTASPEEMMELQKAAVLFAGGISESLKTVKGFENHENFNFYKEDWATRERDKGGDVIKMSGKTQSAAKWIEAFRKDVPSKGPVSEEQLALVFAARQLANAQLGRRGNIDKTQLSEQQIRRHAELLQNSAEFKKYVQENQPINAKLFHSGHGGKLEQTFQDFLNREGKEDLEFDVKNRYKKGIVEAKKINEKMGDWVDVDKAQVMNDIYNSHEVKTQEREQYKGYRDYFNKNISSDKESLHTLAQAARMAAANDLSRRKPDNSFDRKELDKRAHQFLKDPTFRVVTTIKGNADLICQGKAEAFAEEVDSVNTACEAMIDNDGELEVKGYVRPSLDRLEDRVEKNPDLKAIVDSVNDLYDGEPKQPKDVINALSNIIEYQNKHCADAHGEIAKDLNDTIRLMHEMTKNTSLNSMVDNQIDMINKARGIEPEAGEPRFLTKNFIAKEGIQEEQRAMEELGIGIKAKPEQKKQAVEPENEALNNGMNLGHGPVA